MVVVAISGQSLAMAGGNHGGFHGGNMSSNMSKPSFNNVQPHVNKSIGNVMPQQTLKTQQFQNHTNNLMQTQKLTHIQTPNNVQLPKTMQLPKNVNLGLNQTKVDPLKKVGPLFDPKGP